MSLHLAKWSTLNSQTQSNTFVLLQYFLAAAAHSSLLLSDCVLKVPDSQDSIVWCERSKNMVAACLPGSVLDRFGVTLFCVMKTELNMTLLVVQTILPAMSHLCQVHTINTKTHCNLALRIALMFQFGVQDTSKTHRPHPGRNLNFSSLLLQYVFFLSFPPDPLPFPCVLLLHPSCLRSPLSNYQRLACRLVTLD